MVPGFLIRGHIIMTSFKYRLHKMHIYRWSQEEKPCEKLIKGGTEKTFLNSLLKVWWQYATIFVYFWNFTVHSVHSFYHIQIVYTIHPSPFTEVPLHLPGVPSRAFINSCYSWSKVNLYHSIEQNWGQMGRKLKKKINEEVKGREEGSRHYHPCRWLHPLPPSPPLSGGWYLTCRRGTWSSSARLPVRVSHGNARIRAR
jgi:hypothetical protein